MSLKTQLTPAAYRQCLNDAFAAYHRQSYATAADVMMMTGMEPDPWQMELLTSTHSDTVLNCCRQSGKSTSTAALALWTAISRPDALVLCVAPALRQSQELFKKIMDAYAVVPYVPEVVKMSALRVQLRNGSRIIVLPDQERTIRGYSAVTMCVIDEASGVRDETYYTLRPMLAVSRSQDSTAGRMVILSTPRGQRGFFYDTWTDGGPEWMRVRVQADEVARITPEFLAGERAQLGDIWYRQEYFCQFLAPTNAVFDYDAITDAGTDITPLMKSPYMTGVEPSAPTASMDKGDRDGFYRRG